MDAFYASVEVRDNPALVGQPVIVGAGPHDRGVVAAASYEARRYGVHSAMPARTAYQLCPHGIFIRPDMAKYGAVSRQIMTILETFTPAIEPVSIDEAFLDVTGSLGLYGDALTIAKRIKAEIHAQTGLTASVGVAPNKFLAKLASDLNKPDGLTVLTEETKVQVLAPLPVAKLWGVGKVTERRLQQHNLRTIGDIQRLPVAELRRRIGNAAEHLHALALGEDDRPVATDTATKSISSEHTFDVDTADMAQIKKSLLAQCEEVGARLRQEKVAARTVQLKLRHADFTTLTRRRTLPQPTQDEMQLYEVAGHLLAAENIAEKRIRLIGVGGSNLVAPVIQDDLFDRGDEKRARLAKAVDELRDKLGPEAIQRGSAIT
ncbi:MAG: DNA polymerase IV [Verrucomicrobiae bacterium]|nr:DNA polymerase IV [Verrucomicrobiae bacterium]